MDYSAQAQGQPFGSGYRANNGSIDEWWDKESDANEEVAANDKILSKGYEFHPTRLIVLSELPIKKKEHYYALLLNNRAKLAPDGSGRYIANVRLLGPEIKKSDLPLVMKKDHKK
jgi:hypothetical protein